MAERHFFSAAMVDKFQDCIIVQDRDREKREVLFMKNEEYLSIFGPVQQYSPGTGMVMADRQIKRAIEKGSAHLDEIGNLKAVVTFRPTG